MGFISEWRDFRMNDAHPAQSQAKPHTKAAAGNWLAERVCAQGGSVSLSVQVHVYPIYVCA